jgi:hypothetical protein
LKVLKSPADISLAAIDLPQVLQGGAFAIGGVLGKALLETGLTIDPEGLLTKPEGLPKALLLVSLLTLLHQGGSPIDLLHLALPLGPGDSG